jgi:hypothetical protein
VNLEIAGLTVETTIGEWLSAIVGQENIRDL